MFEARLVLAATLSPTYGIYSGYEWFEHTAVSAGSEEYLDSEKYETKAARARGRAAQRPRAPAQRGPPRAPRAAAPVQHHVPGHRERRRSSPTSSARRRRRPRRRQPRPAVGPGGLRARARRPRPALGLPGAGPARRQRYDWHLGRNYVRLEPGDRQAHLFRVVKAEATMATQAREAQTTRPRASSSPRASAATEAEKQSLPVKQEKELHAADPSHWFERDPLWFKSAFFYEIHLRGFYDGNDDGSGDFVGLTEKLDYLQWLGVDCIWLLPMFASPLRDGGYDIADFYGIHPDYGTVEDFETFMLAAHERGIRVIADLVMNHTSSDHQWFQDARNAPRRLARARQVRVVGHRREVQRRADHLHRHRDLQLDLGPGRRPVLLAPLLLPPARPQLRQPGRPRARCSTSCASGWTSGWTASASTPCPTSTSARAPTARTWRRRTSSCARCARPSTRSTPTASCWPRPTSGPRTSSSTTARATATSATWPSTSRSCRACSCPCAARTRRRWPRSSSARPRSRAPRSGACSCATTTS